MHLKAKTLLINGGQFYNDLQISRPYRLWKSPNVFVTDSDLLYNMSHPPCWQGPTDTMVPHGFVNDSLLCKHLGNTPSGISMGCPDGCDIPSICCFNISVTYHVPRTIVRQ